jgi:hypothetical protein
MKNIFFRFVLFILVITCSASCKKNFEQDDTNSAALHSCTRNQIEPYICFDSLLEDSRCPVGAECFWQGTALIKVSFHETNQTHVFIMSLKGFPGLGYPADTTINGYRIIFIDLKPLPDVNRAGPKPSEIKAFFSISS